MLNQARRANCQPNLKIRLLFQIEFSAIIYIPYYIFRYIYITELKRTVNIIFASWKRRKRLLN